MFILTYDSTNKIVVSVLGDKGVPFAHLTALQAAHALVLALVGPREVRAALRLAAQLLALVAGRALACEVALVEVAVEGPVLADPVDIGLRAEMKILQNTVWDGFNHD